MGKRAANKVRNEQEILETAIQLFIKNGDEETTIGDIVAATSLARGTFYNYFKSKKEIWDKIIADLMQDLHKNAFKERSQSTTVREFIYESFFAALTIFDTTPNRELIAKNPASFRDAFFRNQELDVIITIFERDMRSSNLFKGMPDYFYKMTVYSMLGASLEILIQSYLRGDGYTAKQITEYITLIFEKSLLAVDFKHNELN